MLPRKSISCWLHRCLPARWEEMLVQDSWTWDRHQPSAHGSRSCVILPGLFDDDGRTDCVQHQPRSPQASEQLGCPCWVLQVLPSCSLKKQNRHSGPCAPSVCDTDYEKNPKPRSEVQRKTLSINLPLHSKKLCWKNTPKTAAFPTCLGFGRRARGPGRVSQTCSSVTWVSPPAEAPRTRLWCSFS